MEEKNVYKRLQEARAKLKNTSLLKKSGDTTKYLYFELGDFLPAVIDIFNDIGLCSVITFNIDNDIIDNRISNQSKFVGVAKLEIINSDNPSEKIIFSSPFVEMEETKMNNPIQLLGGVQTYMRRYLYMLALDIVENDLIEKLPKEDESQLAKPSKKTTKSDMTESVTPPTAEEDFDKTVRDIIKDIAVKNLPIKKDLVEFIKKDVGISLKDIGTTSSENLQKINEFIKNYVAPTEPSV